MTPEQIRQLRERLKLTQGQMAERLLVHRCTVNQWETGKKEPRRVYVEYMRTVMMQEVAR